MKHETMRYIDFKAIRYGDQAFPTAWGGGGGMEALLRLVQVHGDGFTTRLPNYSSGTTATHIAWNDEVK